ncbi:hypothetical protein MF406_14910 [Georgenia sp. TF02-10]|uniref:hypothetical protein n=1 Tax=Georgenia sp. TF02-10 TaxID=2917725 RepID=UPI001FA8054E|nr:hypothetical protein [Georgenia sp. TF02-10]UNX54202.1 hypothetical protein MF406_14910 [Georgenia sp. TF02-10]
MWIEEDEAPAGVIETSDGRWAWWARWLGGVEVSLDTYSTRDEAVAALLSVLRED